MKVSFKDFTWREKFFIIIGILWVISFGYAFLNNHSKKSKIQHDQIESTISRFFPIKVPDTDDKWQIMYDSLDGSISGTISLSTKELITSKIVFDKEVPLILYVNQLSENDIKNIMAVCDIELKNRQVKR